MPYRYVKTKEHYDYLASGHVFYNALGLSAFPIRLASEIAQRCFKTLEKEGHKGPYILYDPCCGGAYLLTIIGLLHGEKLKEIIGSDCKSFPLEIAQKNLSLLHLSGLNKRLEELGNMAKAYHKISHQQALQSALKIFSLVRSKRLDSLKINFFQADITTPPQKTFKADIIITDLPYGNLTYWETKDRDPLSAFLSNITTYMIPHLSILALVTDKTQKIDLSGLQRIEHFKMGKRRIIFLKYCNKEKTIPHA